MHRTTSALAAALLLIGTLAACSDGKSDQKATTQSASPEESPAAAAEPKKLADTYTEKLDAVSQGSVANCQTPSSTECSNAIGAIMIVVADLKKDIDANGGAGSYPETTKQIATMRTAQQEYQDNACEGNPKADDPNSDCWSISNITVGATTLSVTLGIDES